MLLSIRQLFWIYFPILIGYQISAVPLEYDGGEDFDTKQSQARYDPKLLSQELKDRLTSSQERAAGCYAADIQYEHGQKVSRKDPCEVCLCVDGEIFCWWKRCEHITKRKKNLRKDKQNLMYHNRKQLMKMDQQKFKIMKFIPKKILNFPQHLPAILHFDFDKNNTKTIVRSSSEDSPVSTLLGKKTSHRMETKPIPMQSQLSSDSTYEDDLNINSHIMNKHQRIGLPLNKESLSNQQLNLYEKGLINDYGGETKVVENDRNVFYKIKKMSEVIGKWKKNLKQNDRKYIKNIENRSNKTSSLINDNKPIETKSNTNMNQFKEHGFVETKNIQFVDVPLTKHYIITSSGSFENSDMLASDNVLSKFRNGYSVMVEPPNINANISNSRFNDNNLQESTNNPLFDILGSSSRIKPTISVKNLSEDSSKLVISHISTTKIETTQEPYQQECLVMGKSYKIGTILPQDTGNCLQCICIEGANPGDSPRVTCSPHNCPPLVLPDLFDTTGY